MVYTTYKNCDLGRGWFIIVLSALQNYKIVQDLCYLCLFGRLNFQLPKNALCIDEHGW